VKEIDVITAGNNDAIALSDGIGNVGSDGIGRDSDGLDNISAVISEQFRRFFIGYSQAINKQEGRTGSLFQKGFKRIHIDSQEHLIYLVYYIHANPQNHEIVKDFRRYLYSSYSGILIDKPTNLRKQEVVDWFGSKSEYTEFHDENQDLKDIQRFMIED
jgi:hypothetical protein